MRRENAASKRSLSPVNSPSPTVVQVDHSLLSSLPLFQGSYNIIKVRMAWGRRE